MLSTTTMANPFITAEDEPTGRVFIFGSWLNSPVPKDLDLVFIYDDGVCSPQDAIIARQALKECGARLGLTIHVILLSEAENAQCGFIKSVGAVPLKTWANEHPDDLLHRFTEGIANVWESQRASFPKPRVAVCRRVA
jgi:hypothetical protein